MKRIISSILACMLTFTATASASDGSFARENVLTGFETAVQKHRDTQSKRPSPLLDETGVHLRDLNYYCDSVPAPYHTYEIDGYYGRTYENCSMEHQEYGDNEKWAVFKDYKDALIATGYYKLVHHEIDLSDTPFEHFYLVYTGSEAVTNTVPYTNDNGDTEYASISIKSTALGFGRVFIEHSTSISITTPPLKPFQYVIKQYPVKK